MKSHLLLLSEACDASLDGPDQFLYHAVDHRGGERSFRSTHGPDSVPMRRLASMNRTLALVGLCRRGWGEEIESRLVEEGPLRCEPSTA